MPLPGMYCFLCIESYEKFTDPTLSFDVFIGQSTPILGNCGHSLCELCAREHFNCPKCEARGAFAEKSKNFLAIELIPTHKNPQNVAEAALRVMEAALENSRQRLERYQLEYEELKKRNQREQERVQKIYEKNMKRNETNAVRLRQWPSDFGHFIWPQGRQPNVQGNVNQRENIFRH